MEIAATMQAPRNIEMMREDELRDAVAASLRRK